MYAHHYPQTAAAFERPAHWPLPLKALAVALGFALFKPLGLAALIYFLVQARRRWRGQGFARCATSGGNSAFDAHRKQTLETLAEEERAFAEFHRQQREAQDRADFERFRNTKA